jgi:hypothetical protein
MDRLNQFWLWITMIVLAFGIAFVVAFLANVSQNGAPVVSSPAVDYGSAAP